MVYSVHVTKTAEKDAHAAWLLSRLLGVVFMTPTSTSPFLRRVAPELAEG